MSPRTRQSAEVRDGDPQGITIKREIPLWGLLTVGGMLLIQAVVMWNGQNIQAQQITELTKKFDKWNDKQETKEQTDLKQDMQISAILSRIVVIESSKKSNP